MTGLVFRQDQKVLFKHCDPAGIVFYPRYFEIINDCVEAFFAKIDHPFEDLHKTHAVPTVRIETEFPHPSRHGDVLDIALHLTRIGRSSASVSVDAICDGKVRLTCRSVLVHVGRYGRPVPWPDDLRAALTNYLTEDA